MGELVLHGNIKAPSHRIISLVPSITEILFYLGLDEAVVGVTQNCDYPPAAKRVRKVGLFLMPDMKKVLELSPDIVIGLADLHQGFTKILDGQRTGLILVDYHSVQSVLNVMDGIASLAVDKTTALGLVTSLRKRVESLRRDIENRRSVRTLFVMSDDPIVIPGCNSYQYDALEIIGAVQISYSVSQYERVTLEQVVHFDPEVIFTCGRHRNEPPHKKCPGCHSEAPICRRIVEDIALKPQWRETSAAREQRIYPVRCHWLCRPGPRLIDGMEAMAAILSRYETMRG